MLGAVIRVTIVVTILELLLLPALIRDKNIRAD